jgi:hypothetical protein
MQRHAPSSTAIRFFRRMTSCSFSSSASFSSAALRSLFARGVFTMRLARTPNRSVDMVSSRFSRAGEQFTTSDVRELPPSDSCSGEEMVTNGA